MNQSLRKKCISPYSVRMRENVDENNSEYGHFPHSESRLSYELSIAY